MSKITWEQRVQNFLENHPDELVDAGVDETDPRFYLTTKLQLSNSMKKVSETIAFADLIRFMDIIRDEAYSKLIIEERSRLAMKPEDFQSDGFLKARIRSMADLKQYIASIIEEGPEISEQLTKLKEES